MDGQGRRSNFHALRVTFGTNLQRRGVSARDAMELMRHSDMRLTNVIYTDTTALPLAQAMEKLPAFLADDSAVLARTETDGASHRASHDSVATGQSLASSGTPWASDGDSQVSVMSEVGTPCHGTAEGKKKAGEGIRTLDIHVGNVTLYR